MPYPGASCDPSFHARTVRHDGGLVTIRRLALEVRSNDHLRREAYAMSLYVSIVLLSALSVFDDDHPPDQGEVFLLELGTTVGLVLAHAFASWVSTRIIGEVAEETDPWDLLKVQLGGALAVASFAMLAVLVAPQSVELQAARLTVATAIAAQVFLESRTSNSTVRAVVYSLVALVAGGIVATIKALLVH